MRLNGGEFLLNLLVLGALTISSESVTITDESVIKQLTGLKNYINNEKAIKPLFVKFDNGTEIVVAKGEIRKTKGALSFELSCATKSNSLTINVAFTQMVNANDGPIDDYEIESGDATLTFTNDMSISGDLEVVGKITGGEIVETPLTYSATIPKTNGYTKNGVYCGVVKNGNKITVVIALEITKTSADATSTPYIANINIPAEIGEKLYPVTIGGNPAIDSKIIQGSATLSNLITIPAWLEKSADNNVLRAQIQTSNMVVNTKYYVRYEATFLLSNNLLPSGD